MSSKWQEALVTPLRSPKAERLAHYFAMLHDLDLANMSLVRMAQHQSMRDHEDSDVVSENIYLDYALMHYFRCFGTGKQSLGLRIFQSIKEKDKRREAKRLHRFFLKTYHLKSKRPPDIFSTVKIGVTLKDDKTDQGVQDIFWLMNRFQLCKPELTKVFSQLVLTVKEQVATLAQITTDDLLNEAKNKGNKALYATALNAKDFAAEKYSKITPIQPTTKKV